MQHNARPITLHLLTLSFVVLPSPYSSPSCSHLQSVSPEASALQHAAVLAGAHCRPGGCCPFLPLDVAPSQAGLPGPRPHTCEFSCLCVCVFLRLFVFSHTPVVSADLQLFCSFCLSVLRTKCHLQTVYTLSFNISGQDCIMLSAAPCGSGAHFDNRNQFLCTYPTLFCGNVSLVSTVC